MRAERCADRRLLHGSPRPTVVSLSWAIGTLDQVQGHSSAGGGDKSVYTLFEDALQEAMVLGITVCCASGN